MYKPVPQTQSTNDGEDSESELFSSTTNYDGKSQNDDQRDEASSLQLPMELPPMTTLRKVALAFSIVNCIGFVILFLWILPCDYDTCQAPHRVITKDWEITLKQKIVEAVTVASSKTNFKDMLIFLSSVNSNRTDPSALCSNNETTNVIGIRATDGKIVWEKDFTDSVEYLNCTLLDVNSDGVNDCLLFPVAQTLSVFNSLTGSLLWQLKPIQRNSSKTFETLDGRKMIDIDSIADINNDTVTDIVLILSDFGGPYFLVVSGKDGELIFQSILNSSCIPNDRSGVIASIISSSCITALQGSTLKHTLTNRFVSNREVSSLNNTSCSNCDALTDGIPKSRYLLHQSDDSFLVRAIVNCSTLSVGTVVKKSSL